MPKAWTAKDKKAGMTIAELRDFVAGEVEGLNVKAVVSIRGRLQKIETVEIREEEE
jgi:hypothetical protein